MTSEPKADDLRVWWMPQVPMEAFTVPIPDIVTGRMLCDALAAYDAFQFEHNVKPDYSNAGGIQVYESDGESMGWFDVCDEDGEQAWT